MDETTPLHDKAAEWLRRQGVLDAQKAKEVRLKGEMEDAQKAHNTTKGEEKEARDEKDSKREEAEHYCAIMRGENRCHTCTKPECTPDCLGRSGTVCISPSVTTIPPSAPYHTAHRPPRHRSLDACLRARL